MSDDQEMSEACVQAITVAANDLGLDPRAFADELSQGEIALLVQYLAAAAEHVGDLPLRVHIDELLHRLTTWTRAE